MISYLEPSAAIDESEFAELLKTLPPGKSKKAFEGLGAKEGLDTLKALLTAQGAKGRAKLKANSTTAMNPMKKPKTSTDALDVSIL